MKRASAAMRCHRASIRDRRRERAGAARSYLGRISGRYFEQTARPDVAYSIRRCRLIEYVFHVVVERARPQGVLYQLQDVSCLADEPTHQPKVGVVLVGKH